MGKHQSGCSGSLCRPRGRHRVPAVSGTRRGRAMQARCRRCRKKRNPCPKETRSAGQRPSCRRRRPRSRRPSCFAGGRKNHGGPAAQPDVGFTPTYDTTTPPPWILGLTWDIPIETAGKRGKRIGRQTTFPKPRAGILLVPLGRHAATFAPRCSRFTPRAKRNRCSRGRKRRKATSSDCWKASLPPARCPVTKSRRRASRSPPRGWHGRTPSASPPGACAIGRRARFAVARAGRREIFIRRAGPISTSEQYGYVVPTGCRRIATARGPSRPACSALRLRTR